MRFQNGCDPNDCVQKIQHQQYVELKIKARVFAKMAINTNYRKIFRKINLNSISERIRSHDCV